MWHETQRPRQPAPDLWIWFLWVVLTVAGGIVGQSLIIFLFFHIPPNLDLLAVGGTPFYLASPLFFVSLGQWLLLRHFVARSGLWVWSAVLGIFFMCPFLSFYSFSALSGGGKLNGEQLTLTFGTPEFWHAISVLTALSCMFGSLIGVFQGVLIIRRYSTKRGRIPWWIIANAIAWGAGYPLGEHVMPGLLWYLRFGDWQRLFGYELPPFSWADEVLKAASTWLIIGLVTGAVLIWLANTLEPAPSSTPTS